MPISNNVDLEGTGGTKILFDSSVESNGLNFVSKNMEFEMSER